jgi:hypothetical protein
MVNYIDNLDAKMNQTTTLTENEPGDNNWTGYQRSLETNSTETVCWKMNSFEVIKQTERLMYYSPRQRPGL